MNFYKLILYYEKNYSNMCKDKLKIYFYIPNTQTGRIISDFFRHALSILMLFYLILVFFGLVVPIHILKSCLACQHISAFFLNLLFFSHIQFIAYDLEQCQVKTNHNSRSSNSKNRGLFLSLQLIILATSFVHLFKI